MSLVVLLREISVRHWVRAPVRSVLIVLGIALGVALYVATEAAADSMFAAFGELVTRVANRADLTIQAGGVGIAGERVADVAELPGVAHAAATLEVTTQATDFHESLLRWCSVPRWPRPPWCSHFAACSSLSRSGRSVFLGGSASATWSAP